MPLLSDNEPKALYLLKCFIVTDIYALGKKKGILDIPLETNEAYANEVWDYINDHTNEIETKLHISIPDDPLLVKKNGKFWVSLYLYLNMDYWGTP